MGYEFFMDAESLVRFYRQEASPAFEALIGRIRDERVALGAADFDPGFSFPANPIFRMLFPPVIMQSVRMFADLPSERKVALRQEVFDPYAAKWREVCEALRTRYPQAVTAVVDFSAKAAEALTMIVCAAEVAPGRTDERFVSYSDKYSAMQTAFMRIGELVENCADENRTENPGGFRVECFNDRFQAQDYLRNLVARMKNELGVPSHRQVVIRYIVGDENPLQFAQEVDRAKDLVERWRWRESTLINFTKPAHTNP